MKKMEILWNYYKTRAINSQKIMKNGKEIFASAGKTSAKNQALSTNRRRHFYE